MKLSVIVPVYNEHETVLTLLSKLKAVGIEKEILVIDNCSTDGTRELLGSLDDSALTILFQPRNYGKGTSVRKGIAESRGDYVVMQDADLEYDPQDLVRLLEVAEAGHPVVFGSRLLNASTESKGESPFYLGRLFVSLVFRFLYFCPMTDVATCYKFMRSDVAKALNLKSRGFDLDFEIAAKLRKAGHEIHEVPISYYPRSRKQGKKLRARDGLRALWTLLRYRFAD